MSIEIVKFNKSLSIIDSETILASDGMTIDHYSDVIKTAEGEIEFIISPTNCQIPELEDPDYCVVIREKVDLTALGSNELIITDRDKDIGNKNYKNSSPYTPVDLPPGFIELKGEK